MATNTYVALDLKTVTTPVTSVQFTGISSAYTDLVLVISARDTTSGTGNTDMFIQFNGDTGSNYSFTQMYGNGSSAASNRGSNLTYIYAGSAVPGGIASGTYSTTVLSINNYSNSTTYKTVLTRTGLANSLTAARVGLWRNTNAITSFTVYLESSFNFAIGSTFSLYGIASASVGAKATGGIITSDDTYYYHTFLASGAFTPLQSLSADCLVVGGGGNGGDGNSGVTYGAGGASGILRAGTQTLTTTSYTVTVGAGGAYSGTSINNGTSSLFYGTSTITATGGNGTGTSSTGGSNADYSGAGSPGGSAAGGGAGATSNASGSNGGSGSSAYSTWASATGTGVSGAYGGGGAGGPSGTASAGGGTYGVNAKVNTGGGGSTSNGGSGLVIVRYAK